MSEKIKILKDRTEKQTEEDNILERHPDWPQLNVMFYFAPHRNAHDMEGVAPHLAEADILLYENTGRTPETRKLYDRISQRPPDDIETTIDTSTYKGVPVRGHSTEPLVRGLYGTGKAVGTLDIGKTHSDIELIAQAQKELSKIASRGLSYRSALLMTKDNVREAASSQAEREERMVNNFEEELEFIFKIRPDLLEKETVNVLVTMGAFHTSLGRRFDKHGISSTRDFSRGPDYTYGYKLELMRDFMYGVKPSEKLLQHALSEDIVYLALGQELAMADDMLSDDFAEYVRRYVSTLSAADQEELFELYRSDRLSIDSINDSLPYNPKRPKLVKTSAELETANKNYHIRVKKLGKAVRH